MKRKVKKVFLVACVGLMGFLGMFALGNPQGTHRAVAADGRATVTTGWVQGADGRWWYRYANGSYPANTWKRIQGRWYYFDAQGWMKTGWIQSGGSWYYLNGSGAMQTGWLKEGAAWYYLNGSGAMQTGWLWDGRAWYYLKDSGAMQTGWLKEGATWYYLNESGAMQTGWLQEGSAWYYLNGRGAMKTGWITSGKLSYYLDEKSGRMLADTITPTGHYVHPDGHRSKEEGDITYKKTGTVTGNTFYRKYYKTIATEDTAVMDASGKVTERENKITLELLKNIKLDQGERLLTQLDQKNKREGFKKVGEAHIAFDWLYHTFDKPVYGVMYEKMEENTEQGYGGKHYIRIYSLETGELCGEYEDGLKEETTGR